MSAPAPYQMSQGLTILSPKSGNAYPIPVDEWKWIKEKVRSMTNEPWFFHSTGFLLFGACASTFISILIGSTSKSPGVWAVVAVTGICGGLCLYFASKERGVERTRATDIVTQMDIIERRFEPDARVDTGDKKDGFDF